LLVRPATSADIPAMMALEKRAATAAHWSREHYVQILAIRGPGVSQPRRLALVIEGAGTVQGFLIARHVEREWELENIAISGPARRRGLGTRLLGEFLDIARQQGAAEAVFLEVRESNCAARVLYEKWAFVESSRRRRYYLEPEEDAIVYRLEFP
jgi:ribosomal-protein-alanine N-acetyltransferase